MAEASPGTGELLGGDGMWLFWVSPYVRAEQLPIMTSEFYSVYRCM